MAEAQQPDIEVRPLPDPGKEVPASPIETADPTWSLPSMFTLDPRVAQQQQEVYGKMQGVLGEQQAGTLAEIERRKQAAAKTAPLYDAAAAAAGQPLPAPPAATQMPEAPSGPVVDPEAFKSFFGPMWLFGLLMSKVGRGDMVTGLNALSAGMTGYATGAKEKAAHDFEVWKAKTEKALNEERSKLERYRNIIENRKYDVQAKMQMLSIEAMREDDQRMQFALMQQNWAGALKAYENQAKMLAQQGNSAMKFYGTLQANLTRADHYKAMEDHQRAALDALTDYRQQQVEARNRGDMNKAMSNFNKEFNGIESRFASFVKAAALKAGTNPDLVKESIQFAAQQAAEEFKVLRSETEGMQFSDEQTLTVRGHEQAADPGYWYAKAKGFAGLEKYISQPPVIQMNVAPTPQQAAPTKGPTMPDGTPVQVDQ